MKKLKFAIIGCGRISQKHIEAIVENNQDAELMALSDIVEEKAKMRAEEYKVKLNYERNPKVYTDYKKMLQDMDIDVVTIATESGYHSEIALYCLNDKKHVIVEKPMALSTSDADEMIRAAEANKVKLCVCHQNRFNIPIQRLKKAIKEDRFGKLVNITARILWNRDMEYYKQASWRGTYKLDGGTLMNQCIHNIDLLQWMMEEEIDTIYAQMGTFLRDIEAEDFGAIIIRFKNGSIGIIEGSACVYPKNLEETLSVFGEKATVVIGGLAVNRIETWRFADGKDFEKDVLKYNVNDQESIYGVGHIPLFKNMIDAINNDTHLLIDGREGKKALEIILGAYKSQLTGDVVKCPIGDFSSKDMK